MQWHKIKVSNRLILMQRQKIQQNHIIVLITILNGAGVIGTIMMVRVVKLVMWHWEEVVHMDEDNVEKIKTEKL